MRRSNVLAGLGLVAVTAAAGMVNAVPALAQERPAAKPAGSATALAQTAADTFIARRGESAVLFKGSGDRLVRKTTYVGGNGLRYVSYDRTYRGLPVAGGDAVVLTDAGGVVKAATTGLKSAINVPTTARISSGKAATVAKKQLKRVDDSAAPKLVVDAFGKTPRLAWEVLVGGLSSKNGPSKLHVFVDAQNGRVLHTSDEVDEGTGHGFYSGTVTLDTTRVGTSYELKDPKRPGLQCGEESGSSYYTNTTDVWGDGSGTDPVTACADAMYAAQQEIDMLSAWMGRDGVDGNGGSVPMAVGLSDVNAYWDGSMVTFGHNQAGTQQATALDIVGHEIGHAIFQYTPGGRIGSFESGLKEGASDIWGTLTEAYANNPNDKPDYDIGERVNLLGAGPLRYMHNPAKRGDPNCYSSEIPTTETHDAAGPLNHWFYLVAEGSNPTNGNPVSPTCDGSSLPGLGLRTAGKIFYNAELLKTSTWDHAQVRVASLTAAKSLYPDSCTEFATVKAAWDAVSVPAQPGEPTCTDDSNDFSVSLSSTEATLAAGSSATATVSSSVTAGSAEPVTLTASGLPNGVTARFSPSLVTSGASSTLTIATSASTPSGTYTIALTAVGSQTHSAAYTLTVTGGNPVGCSGTNGADVDIPDFGTVVTSSITISDCDGVPSTSAKIEVHIVHTYRGDLKIQLVSPDGTSHPLKEAGGGSSDDVDETFTADLSDATANGTWQLEVEDLAGGDAGHIDSWTLTL